MINFSPTLEEWTSAIQSLGPELIPERNRGLVAKRIAELFKIAIQAPQDSVNRSYFKVTCKDIALIVWGDFTARNKQSLIIEPLKTIILDEGTFKQITLAGELLVWQGEQKALLGSAPIVLLKNKEPKKQRDDVIYQGIEMQRQLFRQMPSLNLMIPPTESLEPANFWIQRRADHSLGGLLTLEAQRKALSLAETKAIYFELVKTIEAIHTEGYAHCDIKPDNILMCGKKAYITDFDHIAPLWSHSEFVSTPYPYWDSCAREGYITPYCDLWGVSLSVFCSIFKHNGTFNEFHMTESLSCFTQATSSEKEEDALILNWVARIALFSRFEIRDFSRQDMARLGYFLRRVWNYTSRLRVELFEKNPNFFYLDHFDQNDLIQQVTSQLGRPPTFDELIQLCLNN
jgi:Serine/threonine protein kinase